MRIAIYLFGLVVLIFVVFYRSEPRFMDWVETSWTSLYALMQHKYFVFKAGRLLRVPIWRLIIHDWSRFLPLEWKAYGKSRDGIEWQRGWVCHVSRNDHHWQYWCTETETLKMPDVCVREMVADWMAISRATDGVYGAVAAFDKSSSKLRVHQETREFIGFLLQIYAIRWEGHR